MADGVTFEKKSQASCPRMPLMSESRPRATYFSRHPPKITRTRIYLETMENVLRNAQKIILDESGTGSGVVPYLPLNELKPAAGSSRSSTSDSNTNNNISDGTMYDAITQDFQRK